jgi:hypothetical protein
LSGAGVLLCDERGDIRFDAAGSACVMLTTIIEKGGYVTNMPIKIIAAIKPPKA